MDLAAQRAAAAAAGVAAAQAAAAAATATDVSVVAAVDLAIADLRSTDDNVRKRRTFELTKLFADAENRDYARTFAERNGGYTLADLIKVTTQNTQAYALKCFVSFMEFNMGWENLDAAFARKLVELVLNPSTRANTIAPAAAVLTKLVEAGPATDKPIRSFGFDMVNSTLLETTEAPYAKLMECLATYGETQSQLNILQLVNALVRNASPHQMDKLMVVLETGSTLKNFSHFLQKIRSMQAEDNAADLTKEIDTFLELFMEHILRRRNMRIDLKTNIEHVRLWNEIKTASGIVSEPELIQALGFVGIGNIDVHFAPAGRLGLELLASFVRKNTAIFAKAVMDYRAQVFSASIATAARVQACPIGVAILEMARALVDHLHAFHKDYEKKRFPIVLVLEEVHSTCVFAFMRLWQEVGTEVKKLVQLLQAQLEFAVREPEPSQALLKSFLLDSTVKEMRRRELENIESGADLFGKQPIAEFREAAAVRAKELVREQRLASVTSGAWFAQYNAKGRTNTFRFYKLSANKKSLHYSEDVERKGVDPEADSLPNKVEMAQVFDIKTGLASPLAAALEKSRKKGTDDFQVHQIISLMSQDGETSLADFVCDNDTVFAEWADGFRVALDKEMAQKETEELISTLSSIDIKIKAVDIRLHQVSIADTPPVVPEPPPNFDFVMAAETM